MISNELDNRTYKMHVWHDPESGGKSHTVLSPAEQVDEIMDHSIEIDSNKRIRDAHVNPWTLQFKDKSTEQKVSLIAVILVNKTPQNFSRFIKKPKIFY